MAQDNFNATNVPHYAPRDTPRIDLSPNAAWRDYLDDDFWEVNEKARFGKAQIARRRYIKAKFPPGTRFVLRVEEMTNDAVLKSYAGEDVQEWRSHDRKVWKRYTGVVREMTKPTWAGSSVLVTLDPDSPQYKNFKEGRGKFGTSTFADEAKKVVQLIEPCKCKKGK